MKFNLLTYTTNYFSTKVWVQCPKCAEKALVIAEPSEYIIPLNNEAKMQCTSCSFKAETNDVWNGYCQGFINQSCGFCGSEITHNTKPTKELYKNKNIKCNTCKKEK